MAERNGIVLQCGGPTAVINASLAAVIAGAIGEAGLSRLWGARRGWRGLASGDWVELGRLDAAERAALAIQPGAALGSGRDPLTAQQIPELLGQLKKHAVEVVWAIGGTGTMAAAQKIAEAGRLSSTALTVVGVPKTIDNDLEGTDFCPGYGSAARFLARATRDVGLDLSAMAGFDEVAIFEVMGRDTGWLAAATVLARTDSAAPPHLLLLPEVPFRESVFLEAVQTWHIRNGTCLVVVSEGVRDEAGRSLAEQMGSLESDAQGQKLFSRAGGPAPYLASLIQQRLGLRCRQIRPDTVQRVSSLGTSAVDREQAMAVGSAAVRVAAEGHSEVMIGLARQQGSWRTRRVPFAEVAGRQRPLPSRFINPNGLGVTAEFVEYAAPLVGERLTPPIVF